MPCGDPGEARPWEPWPRARRGRRSDPHSGGDMCALGAAFLLEELPAWTHDWIRGAEAFWGQRPRSTALVSGDKAAPSPPRLATKSPLMLRHRAPQAAAAQPHPGVTRTEVKGAVFTACLSAVARGSFPPGCSIRQGCC